MMDDNVLHLREFASKWIRQNTREMATRISNLRFSEDDPSLQMMVLRVQCNTAPHNALVVGGVFDEVAQRRGSKVNIRKSRSVSVRHTSGPRVQERLRSSAFCAGCCD